MCEFISWVEAKGKVLFLTAEDVKSKYGKETLEGVLDNDPIGHGAIRKFYGLEGKELSGGVNKENRDFWNGNLPQEIKEAWNSGSLDGMLRYLQSGDVEYILEKAPADFSMWVITQKFRKDNEAMKKDTNWRTRLAGLAATRDYEAMKKDPDGHIRLVGLAATQDYEAMKKDTNWYLRLAGLAATCNLDTFVRPVIK